MGLPYNAAECSLGNNRAYFCLGMPIWSPDFRWGLVCFSQSQARFQCPMPNLEAVSQMGPSEIIACDWLKHVRPHLKSGLQIGIPRQKYALLLPRLVYITLTEIIYLCLINKSKVEKKGSPTCDPCHHSQHPPCWHRLHPCQSQSLPTSLSSCPRTHTSEWAWRC